MRGPARRLFFALLLGCLSNLALAQSAYGPSGLLVHPSAFIDKPHSLSAYLSTYSTETSANHADWAEFSLAYGISEKAEAGPIYVYHRASHIPAHSHYGAFAKYQLFPDTATRPAFAISASYLHHDNLETTAAGVFSHNFKRGDRTLLAGHVGVKYGRAGDDLNFADGVAGFVGVEIPLSRSVRLIGETSSRFSFETRGASAIGLALNFPGGGGIRIGVVDIGRSTDDRFFFGVGYPLGGAR